MTREEGTWAAWLYDLQPQVQHMVVCNRRRNALLKEGSKSDKVDARKLADLSRTGMLVSQLTRTGAFTPVLAKHSKSFSLIDCMAVGCRSYATEF
ncbi:MAG TPA: hypothetical protein VIX37_20175 [Candidatus Sulfotelmatobacter sp.]